jgi:thymidylate synthase
MIEIEMRIAERVDELTGFVARHLRHHHGEQRVRRNVERDAQENVARGKMALAPCHAFFQFYVADRQLSCLLYCRSQDVFLGTPFNWAGYALLTHMIAQQADLQPAELIWTGGDCHLYRNHEAQVDEQLSRTPFPLPQLQIQRKPPSIFEYRFDDFEFRDYRFHPPIRAPIAV